MVVIAAVVAVRLPRPRPTTLPEPGSPLYEQYAEAFQLGVAALDADAPDVAVENLNRAIELIPEEPAAWADRGLYRLRQSQLLEAEQDLHQAHRLAPNNTDVQKLLGLLAERRGQFGAAASYLSHVVERDPGDVETLYLLAQMIEREHESGSDAEYQHLLERILEVHPNNLFVLAEHLRVALRRADDNAVRATCDQFETLSSRWAEDTRKAWAAFNQERANQPVPRALAVLAPFSNLLRAEPGFQRSAAQVHPRPNLIGTSVHTFIRLAPPNAMPAPPDTQLEFAPEPVPAPPAGRWDVALPVWLTSEGQPAVFVANAREVRHVGAAQVLASRAVSRHGVVALDWNNDFWTDLFLAGRDGLRLHQQQNDGTFHDVTEGTGLQDDIVNADYFGAWAADVDLDGDLDLILAPRAGPALLLRNNFDGFFKLLPIFPGVQAARALAWSDLDHDGAPDVAVLDASGALHAFTNERMGQFQKWPVNAPGGEFLALGVADANDDGVLDLIAIRRDGTVVRISDQDKRSSWNVVELARWDSFPSGSEPGGVSLVIADLDNNGVLDLLASGSTSSRVWLGAGDEKFQPLPTTLPPRILAVADFRDSGRLELLGLDDIGQPVRYRNTGRKSYHWQAVRPQAAKREEIKGDNRINSFGIGGEIELRTGTYAIKQPINAPVVHFGLGERTRADVIGILWTNGTFQAEFKQPIDQRVIAEQRLSGSCPFLFTWNGERFVFVTDFMWSSPLGVYEGEQEQGGFLLQTVDWVRIRGDQLVPHDGFYEVRVVANLWETHFYDQLSLLAVDHLANTELFVDERASLDPAQLAFQLVEQPSPVARAWDHHGEDVTSIVSTLDGVYLDRCGRGTYRGVTSDHWVEIEHGDDEGEGPAWLIAQGWVNPVDSSAYFAMAQGKHEPPREPVLEVPDGRGGWRVARGNLGYPAGKNKSVLIRLDGIDGPGVPRRLRLRTNMEIYWDALWYARGRDNATRQEHTLLAQHADLHFRGVLDMTRTNRGSPELPHYDRVAHVGQCWRNLIGFHTRYGDVHELLEKTDDRYVILCAGDEMTLRFAVPPGPRPGWQRDFVWKCDGWTKDGDFNTRFSKTVLPLPAHNLKAYETPPGRLADDPAYRRFPVDWQKYHTRFVQPTEFERGLRPRRTPRPLSSAEAGAERP
jgi:Tfp pilus assembly protein PilF